MECGVVMCRIFVLDCVVGHWLVLYGVELHCVVTYCIALHCAMSC